METILVNTSKSPTRIHVQMAAREVPTPEGGKKIEYEHYTIKLKIGATRLSKRDAAAWEKAKDLPVVASMLERGRLEIKDQPLESKAWKKGDKIEDLSDYKLLDALSAVALCKSTKVLKKWLYQDARPEVQKAIHERYDSLNPMKDDKQDGE